ncbi:MAG: energy-coupling factor ABC transporter permease [Methanomassiliicoccales archaeon]
MEGFLPLEWCLFWLLLSLPFMVWGALRLRKMFQEKPELKVRVAIGGAFIFVLSSLKLPSVAGSSSHPTGTGLSTIISGPAITTILASVVLLFQALLLAHGGLTTLGANIFSMGVVGPFIAFGVYRAMSGVGVKRKITVFTTAFVADIATYVMTSLQLALAFPDHGSVINAFLAFLAIFALSQIPLAIVEGLLIVLFFDYLAAHRPDIVGEKQKQKAPRPAMYAVAAAVAAVLIFVALLANQNLQGTDDAAQQLAQQLAPGYSPWAQNIFSPDPGTEMMLFALQTMIGLAVLMAALHFSRKDSELTR